MANATGSPPVRTACGRVRQRAMVGGRLEKGLPVPISSCPAPVPAQKATEVSMFLFPLHRAKLSSACCRTPGQSARTILYLYTRGK